jgi:hypothetical protein
MDYPCYIDFYKKQVDRSEEELFVCPFCSNDLSPLKRKEEGRRQFVTEICPQCKNFVTLDLYCGIALKPFKRKDLIAIFVILCCVSAYLILILI